VFYEHVGRVILLLTLRSLLFVVLGHVLHRLALLMLFTASHFGIESRLGCLLVFLMELVEELRLIDVPATCRTWRFVTAFNTERSPLRPRTYQHVRL
jgi:hypothetical protein